MPGLIIYIDDDQDDRALLEEAFSGYPDITLLTFENGFNLLEMLQAGVNGICLIILDINMPQINGIELLKMLKADARFKHIPVVMLSTARQLSELDIIKTLATDVITKPARYSELKDLAEKLTRYCKITV